MHMLGELWLFINCFFEIYCAGKQHPRCYGPVLDNRRSKNWHNFQITSYHCFEVDDLFSEHRAKNCENQTKFTSNSYPRCKYVPIKLLWSSISKYLDFRVCCSNLLQVGAFFDPDYLLVAWESRKIVLVNPPKIDHSAQHSVETNLCFSSMDEKNRSRGWRRRISRHWQHDDKRRSGGSILNKVWISHCFTAFLESFLDFARFKGIKI